MGQNNVVQPSPSISRVFLHITPFVRLGYLFLHSYHMKNEAMFNFSTTTRILTENKKKLNHKVYEI